MEYLAGSDIWKGVIYLTTRTEFPTGISQLGFSNLMNIFFSPLQEKLPWPSHSVSKLCFSQRKSWKPYSASYTIRAHVVTKSLMKHGRWEAKLTTKSFQLTGLWCHPACFKLQPWLIWLVPQNSAKLAKRDKITANSEEIGSKGRRNAHSCSTSCSLKIGSKTRYWEVTKKPSVSRQSAAC